MRAPRILVSLSLSLSLSLLVHGAARAQETSHSGTPTDDHVRPVDSDAIVDPSMKRTWQEGSPRAFTALTLDAGYLYLRPRVSVGYGLPFTQWLGFDANPILVGAGYGGYGGARFAVPYFDLRVGARYFSAFQHAYLTPARSYDRVALDDTRRESARLITLEAEVTGAIPVGPGDIVALGSLSSVHGVPEDAYVFEETLRVIVSPPLVWRVRGGYALRLGAHGQHSVGLVADFLHVPKRDDSRTVRAGPVLRVGLSRHFEVRGSFVVTVVSPDSLGLVGGDFTELGVRWRTATE
jgi:hypothetical protein